MLLYRYLLHYGLLFHFMSQHLWLFSLILQGLPEEGECRQLEFWAGKGANIRDLFCTTIKVLKLHESQFWNILKILGEESTRGGPPTVHEGGGRAPLSRGQAVGPLALVLSPKILIKSRKLFRGVSGLLELCKIGFQLLLLFQPEFQLPAFHLFMINLVK